MSRRDPLAVLAKLRRLETLEAHRLLAERQRALQDAERRRDNAVAAPMQEAATAAPDDMAAWVPGALAERERAKLAVRQSANLHELAREGLALRRLAEKQVALLQEEKQRLATLRDRRKVQALLDDLAGRQTD